MGQIEHGGWVYILTNRYRVTLYVGVASDLAARITQHRDGTGSEFCAEHGLTRLVWAEFISPSEEAIAHEKRLKRWHRNWKIELIEKSNPDWDDLLETLLQ